MRVAVQRLPASGSRLRLPFHHSRSRERHRRQPRAGPVHHNGGWGSAHEILRRFLDALRIWAVPAASKDEGSKWYFAAIYLELSITATLWKLTIVCSFLGIALCDELTCHTCWWKMTCHLSSRLWSSPLNWCLHHLIPRYPCFTSLWNKDDVHMDSKFRFLGIYLWFLISVLVIVCIITFNYALSESQRCINKGNSHMTFIMLVNLTGNRVGSWDLSCARGTSFIH